jgi:hypothetical protein
VAIDQGQGTQVSAGNKDGRRKISKADKGYTLKGLVMDELGKHKLIALGK